MLDGVGVPLVHLSGGGGAPGGGGSREQRRPMWTQHEKSVLRLLMRQYAGVTEFDPPDVHKHPIRNEMWRLLTARYNGHPHVRSRDTKQLRKAWENLKYRARKLGSEDAKPSAGGGGRQASNGGPDGTITWPGLEGSVTVSPSGTPSPLHSRDTVGDQADSYWHQSKHEYHGREDRLDIKDEVSDDSETQFRHIPISGEGAVGGGLDGTVLNLHPLVSSLLSGGLGSLATSLSLLASPHPARILLTQPNMHGHQGDSGAAGLPNMSPFKRLIVSAGDSSLGLPDGDLSTAATTSRNSPCMVNISSTNEGQLDSSRADVECSQGIQCSPAGSSSPPPPPMAPGHVTAIGPPSASERLALLRVSAVELQMRQLEEHHAAGLQLLRIQIGQAVSEHEAKMRVLQLQLDYWQRRERDQGLQQQRSADSMESCADNGMTQEDFDHLDNDEDPVT